jgi:cysteine-rich repeat protein
MRVDVSRKRSRSSSTARRALLASATAAVIFAVPPTSSAGPLMLAGHDADDHGFEAVYAGLFDELLANVTNGNTGILAIGADSGTTAGNWIESVAAQMAVPQTVTFVNDAAITTQDFSAFALLHVPSTEVDLPDGGITLAENTLLAARALDVSDFVNDGGGLFGLTQDSAANAYDYLGLFGAITATPVPASGVCDGTGSGGENYDNITSTAGGAALGISDTNIDGCCWHNTFASFASFFQVLAIADEPGCSDIDTQASVIGCLQCSLPGQKSLSPALSTGLPGGGHTVTATLLESVAPNDPVPGVLVTFDVISGPNAGAGGTDTTNAAGQAVFSYTGGATPGVDVITSTCTNPVTLDTIDSNDARRFWDLDCNSNGIADTCDIDCAGFGGECATFGTCGESADINSNGIPDECAICGNSVLEPGEDCDDGNTTAGDCCAADCSFESAGSSCSDGAACNGDETCDGAGSCDPGTDVDCSHLDAGCFAGSCTEPAATYLLAVTVRSKPHAANNATRLTGRPATRHARTSNAETPASKSAKNATTATSRTETVAAAPASSRRSSASSAKAPRSRA